MAPSIIVLSSSVGISDTQFAQQINPAFDRGAQTVYRIIYPAAVGAP